MIQLLKHQFWDSVYQNASDPYIQHKTFWKINNWFCSSPDAHLCIWYDDSLISNANIQAELFVDHFSQETAHEPLPIVSVHTKNEKLNGPLHISELQEAIHYIKATPLGDNRIRAKYFKRIK